MSLKYSWLIILFLFSISATSQSIRVKEVILKDYEKNIDHEALVKNILKTEPIDSSSLNHWLDMVHSKGYLEAWYQINGPDTAAILVVYLGKKYAFIRLDWSELPGEFKNHIGIKKLVDSNSEVPPGELMNIFRKVISQSEGNGYPFASIGLKNMKIVPEGIKAVVDVDPGPLIVFDTLIVNGSQKYRADFLIHYLGLLKGGPYDKLKIIGIKPRLSELHGIKLKGDPREYFSQGKCTIFLETEDQNENALDGYLGILPNQNRSGKVLFTGQLYFRLYSLFRRGSDFHLEWQKPNVQTQELLSTYTHLSMFKSPVNGNFGLELLKQDSSFLNRSINLIFLASVNKHSQTGLLFSYFNSGLLGSELNLDPEFELADMKINYFGLNHRLNTTNDPFFPVSGWTADGSLKYGLKKVGERNNQVQSSQLMINFRLTRYVRSGTKGAVVLDLAGGTVKNPKLYYNDLFRLGGLNSFRGFNENYFYTSDFLTGRLEFRFRLDPGSYLFSFFDTGWLANSINHQNNFPVGFGAGLNLSTTIGNLAVIYALGSEKNLPVDPGNSKIHIGYLGRF